MDKGSIIMMCGLPGSGKTTLAKKFEEERNAVRLCPDEWIIALMGTMPLADADTLLRNLIEKKLLKHAIKLAHTGITSILENGFWTVEDRNFYKDEIKKAGLNVELHFLDAPLDVLWQRVNLRNGGEYPFKIESEYLEKWHTAFEKPSDEEGKDYSNFVKY